MIEPSEVQMSSKICVISQKYDFIDWLLGDVKDSFFPQRIPSLFFQEIKGFIQKRSEYVIQVTFH